MARTPRLPRGRPCRRLPSRAPALPQAQLRRLKVLHLPPLQTGHRQARASRRALPRRRARRRRRLRPRPRRDPLLRPDQMNDSGPRALYPPPSATASDALPRPAPGGPALVPGPGHSTASNSPNRARFLANHTHRPLGTSVEPRRRRNLTTRVGRCRRGQRTAPPRDARRGERLPVSTAAQTPPPPIRDLVRESRESSSPRLVGRHLISTPALYGVVVYDCI
mmetsp:Transcript_2645/g.8274  ORF Transcript_2645/g.8274 Transcript_2645/m.8274 type:complete len:222 (+) Transcript_2645:936-1601(+)